MQSCFIVSFGLLYFWSLHLHQGLLVCQICSISTVSIPCAHFLPQGQKAFTLLICSQFVSKFSLVLCVLFFHSISPPKFVSFQSNVFFYNSNKGLLSLLTLKYLKSPLHGYTTIVISCFTTSSQACPFKKSKAYFMGKMLKLVCIL